MTQEDGAEAPEDRAESSARLPRSPEIFSRIRRRLPEWTPRVIFDVGANVGQSTALYATLFPQAKIFAFEPVPASFIRLLRSTQDLPQVRAQNYALGADTRLAVMKSSRHSVDYAIRPASDVADEADIEVEMRRGLDVMADLSVDRIDFLKVDTEGHDLEVLAGFGPALARVDFLQVEAGMNAYNKTHCSFQQVVDFLTLHDFLLFFIADQKLEFKSGGRPVLRRANPVFIAGRLVDLTGLS